MKLCKKVLDFVLIVVALGIHLLELIWDLIGPIFNAIAKLRLVAKFEQKILGSNPYFSLAYFVVPVIALFPLKLMAIKFMASGHYFMAGCVYLSAKFVGLGLLSHIYHVTQDNLYKIGWVKWGLVKFIELKTKLYQKLDTFAFWRRAKQIKNQIKDACKIQMQRVKKLWLEYKSYLSQFKGGYISRRFRAIRKVLKH